MASRWVVGLLALGILLQPTSALADSAEADRCGQVQELELARAALAEGDRGSALAHLRRADALLRNCQERRPEPRPSADPLRATGLG